MFNGTQTYRKGESKVTCITINGTRYHLTPGALQNKEFIRRLKKLMNKKTIPDKQCIKGDLTSAKTGSKMQ
jgi:hypothetical protein